MPHIADVSYDLNAGISADVDAAVATATGLRLVGFACRESAGSAAAAAFDIVHGATGDGGDKVIPVELAANESKGPIWFADGIPMEDGISINVVSGTVDVTLFYKTLP